MTIGAQHFGQFRDLAIGLFKGGEISELAADMHIDADNLQPRQIGRHGIDLAGAGDGDAELVFAFASGDLGVGFRIDIGVHADGDRRDLAQFTRHDIKQDHLRLALDVELTNAARQSQFDLFAGFADAGKDDPVARHACRLGPAVFPARDHIHPRARLRQRAQHGLVGIGLHRVADQMIHPRKRVVKKMKMPQQRCGGIDIDRRADRGGNLGQAYVFGMQHTVFIEKMIHLRVALCRPGPI